MSIYHMPCASSGLSSLNLLDLTGNLFEKFPRHLPPSISQLYLSNNSMVGVEGDVLQGFPSLRYLRLGRNRLRDGGVDPAAFNLSSLVELDLSYNQLTQIPVVPTTLQYLYLEANQISGKGLALHGLQNTAPPTEI